MRPNMRALCLLLLCIVGVAGCGLPGSGLLTPPRDETPTGASASQPTATEAQPSLEELRATVEAEVTATARAAAAVQTTPQPPQESIAVVEAAPTAPAQPTAAPDQAEGAPAEGSLPTQEKPVFRPAENSAPPTVNIQLVFDSSGSMAEPLPNGETRIAAARRAMEAVIAGMETDDPNLNVGFRVFGHLGDNTEAGRALSCQSTELVVPMQGVDPALLTQATNSWQPTGWTPITLALQQAGESFPAAGENVRNVIIMVSDGEETCDGDPCAAARALRQSQAEVRIDLIGFGLPPEVADKLKCVAENSGGIYTDAADGEALRQTLELAVQASIRRSYLQIETIGPDGQPTNAIELGVTSLRDDQGQPALTADGRRINSGLVYEGRDGLGDSALPLTDGWTRISLNPGTYTFTLAYNGAVRRRPSGGEPTTDIREETFTAVVEEGKVTVVRLGVSGLTLVDAGAPEDIREYLMLEKNINGQWEMIRGCDGGLCIQAFVLPLDEQMILIPGQYRLVSFANSAEGEVLAEFEAEIGQAATLRLEP